MYIYFNILSDVVKLLTILFTLLTVLFIYFQIPNLIWNCLSDFYSLSKDLFQLPLLLIPYSPVKPSSIMSSSNYLCSRKALYPLFANLIFSIYY